ncbi:MULTISPECIES: hypothetical protein [unclassified Caballeronia]|uniref:hypothetical protein n=1 Tax=unclassified Caballeronia TaxID=2646786 RepID=UPI002865B540|nr:MULTISPECIES: hypothetical protein [unclassified Caballeronia]MDR5751300.1 hypothetical protein [Caballeronia sp. LZ024]MDR5844562.1 hypothetical protein [Caballeronia sp. LZ031]
MTHFQSPANLAKAAAEILCAFLNAGNSSIYLEQATQVWEIISGDAESSPTSTARRLKAELESLGIPLRYRSALHAVALIRESESNFRVAYHERRARKLPLCLLTTLVGGVQESCGPFSTFSNALTAVVEVICEVMPERYEPALCKLTKYPFGIDIEIEPINSDFLQFTLRFQYGSSDDLNDFVAIDDDGLRCVMEQVVTNLHRARPGLLVDNAAFPATKAPWLSARFCILDLQGECELGPMDEENLFKFFSAGDSCESETRGATWIVRIGTKAFGVGIYWIDARLPPDRLEKVEETAPGEVGKEVFRRYSLFARSVRGRTKEAISAMQAGYLEGLTKDSAELRSQREKSGECG